MEKPFRTAEEQVDILESRGLKITDREDAVQNLACANVAKASGKGHISEENAQSLSDNDTVSEHMRA